jgi:hypothetical protein
VSRGQRTTSAKVMDKSSGWASRAATSQGARPCASVWRYLEMQFNYPTKSQEYIIDIVTPLHHSTVKSLYSVTAVLIYNTCIKLR